MKYIERVTTVTVLPEGEPIFCEWATTVSIEDEAAGEFVQVSQCRDEGEAKIVIEAGHWPAIRDAIDKMIKECRV